MTLVRVWIVILSLVVASAAYPQFNGCPPGPCNTGTSAAPPASDTALLLEDGANYLLLEDGTSTLCLEGGC